MHPTKEREFYGLIPYRRNLITGNELDLILLQEKCHFGFGFMFISGSCPATGLQPVQVVESMCHNLCVGKQRRVTVVCEETKTCHNRCACKQRRVTTGM